MEEFVKVSVDNELPKEEGKQIVITKTPMGNSNTFGCLFTPNKKGGTWGCSGQVVTHWLKKK